MKTLKLLSTAFLIALAVSTFADDEATAKEKATMNYALKTYLGAVSEGKLTGLTNILDNNVKFTVTSGKKIITYNKTEILTFMKNSENIQQNCATDYYVIESDSSQALIKVTQKYLHFTKVSFVSLANTVKGWKITSVSTSFVS